MRWTEEEYKDLMERKNARDKDRASSEVAIGKPNPRSKPLEKEAPARPDGPVDITIISHLHRLRDTDGCFPKYALDGIVDCGLLAGDTHQDIREIRHRQVKAKKGEEKTEIIISW